MGSSAPRRGVCHRAGVFGTGTGCSAPCRGPAGERAPSRPLVLRRYENKYVKFFKSKPELPPGLSLEVAAAAATAPPGKQPGKAESGETGLSKAAKRNLKRKEKRKQQQEKGERETDGLIQALEKASLAGGDGGDRGAAAPQPACDGAAPASAGEPPASEKSRKVKNLKKKLRQVEELRQRLEAGEIKQPTKEQLEKLGRRKALEEELRDLELDL